MDSSSGVSFPGPFIDNIDFAFNGETTSLPVSCSSFKRASLAILPPRLATSSCSGNDSGLET